MNSCVCDVCEVIQINTMLLWQLLIKFARIPHTHPRPFCKVACRTVLLLKLFSNRTHTSRPHTHNSKRTMFFTTVILRKIFAKFAGGEGKGMDLSALMGMVSKLGIGDKNVSDGFMKDVFDKKKDKDSG